MTDREFAKFPAIDAMAILILDDVLPLLFCKIPLRSDNLSTAFVPVTQMIDFDNIPVASAPSSLSFLRPLPIVAIPFLAVIEHPLFVLGVIPLAFVSSQNGISFALRFNASITVLFFPFTNVFAKVSVSLSPASITRLETWGRRICAIHTFKHAFNIRELTTHLILYPKSSGPRLPNDWQA